MVFDIAYKKHETIIQTGIIRNKGKSPVLCVTPLAGKILQNIMKLILSHVRSCRIIIGLCQQVVINCPIIFPYQDNKTKLVTPFFLFFRIFGKQTFLISMRN